MLSRAWKLGAPALKVWRNVGPNSGLLAGSLGSSGGNHSNVYGKFKVHRRCFSLWPGSSTSTSNGPDIKANSVDASDLSRQHVNSVDVEGSAARLDLHRKRNDGSGLSDENVPIVTKADDSPEAVFDPDLLDLLLERTKYDIGEMLTNAIPPTWVMKYAEAINTYVTNSAWATVLLITLSVQPILIPFLVVNLRERKVSWALQKHSDVLWRLSVQKKIEKNKDEVIRARKAEKNLLQSFGYSKVRKSLFYILEVPTLLSIIYGVKWYTAAHVSMLSSQSFLWIPTMAAPDPYYVFPFIAAVLFGVRMEMGNKLRDFYTGNQTHRAARLLLCFVAFEMLGQAPAIMSLTMAYYNMFMVLWNYLLRTSTINEYLILDYLKPNAQELIKNSEKLQPNAALLVDRFGPAKKALSMAEQKGRLRIIPHKESHEVPKTGGPQRIPRRKR